MMSKGKKNNKEKKNIFAITTFSLLGLMLVVTLSGVGVYRMQMSTIEPELTEEAYKEYHRYYALITANDKTDFWQNVYAGAKQSGEETDDYVEIFGQNMGVDYSVEERMDIAIAANVDGIIVEGEDSPALRQQIQKAEKKNIPVVVASSDQLDSGRISFVGVSQYELGQIYGNQTCELAIQIMENSSVDEPVQVMVLVDQTDESDGQNLLVSGIREEISKNRDIRGKAEVVTYSIDDSGPFSAEESIRDIFVGVDDVPDILICLSEIHTTCAYQAVIDYNKVGVTNIIGYYDSETILNAIDKEIIYSTVSMDAEQMGQYCATALSEYLDMGYVSEYFTVDTYVVNKENVRDYLGGAEDENQE